MVIRMANDICVPRFEPRAAELSSVIYVPDVGSWKIQQTEFSITD